MVDNDICALTMSLLKKKCPKHIGKCSSNHTYQDSNSVVLNTRSDQLTNYEDQKTEIEFFFKTTSMYSIQVYNLCYAKIRET